MHMGGAFHPTKCAFRCWIPRRVPHTLKASMRLIPALFGMLYASIAGYGCSSDDGGPNVAHETPNPPPPESCRTNTDCIVGTTCQVAIALDRAAAPVRNAAAALPACPNACFDPAQCPMGMTCVLAPAVPFACEQCVVGCKHQDCEAGSVCEVDGCQPVTSCDSPEFAGCPANWTCDPESVGQPAVAPYASTTTPIDSDAGWRARAAGCRPLLCSEPDAQACPQYSQCDQNTGSCVAIDCSELGSCPNGGVCREPRTDEGHDAYGCVPANCDEGFSCRPDEVCDVEGTHPSTRGCRAQLCTEGYECLPSHSCRPGMIGVDNHGCLPPPNANGTCQFDTHCSGQYCVLGQCRDQLGVCR
jgi:hypothetical protein